MRGEVASRSPPRSRSRWRTEIPKSVIWRSARARSAARFLVCIHAARCRRTRRARSSPAPRWIDPRVGALREALFSVASAGCGHARGVRSGDPVSGRLPRGVEGAVVLEDGALAAPRGRQPGARTHPAAPGRAARAAARDAGGQTDAGGQSARGPADEGDAERDAFARASAPGRGRETLSIGPALSRRGAPPPYQPRRRPWSREAAGEAAWPRGKTRQTRERRDIRLRTSSPDAPRRSSSGDAANSIGSWPPCLRGGAAARVWMTRRANPPLRACTGSVSAPGRGRGRNGAPAGAAARPRAKLLAQR